MAVGPVRAMIVLDPTVRLRRGAEIPVGNGRQYEYLMNRLPPARAFAMLFQFPEAAKPTIGFR